MELIKEYIIEFFEILNQMSPYLLLGFLFAGILHVSFPHDKINKYLGQKNITSVINGSILGIPLPLCSCGVIPAGISLYKNGASKGSSVSFLISTPQTGVDSILVTYSLLGLPFAIIRPIIALITGFLGGFLTNISDKDKNSKKTNQNLNSSCEIPPKHPAGIISQGKNVFVRMFKYAFIDLLQDISKWLIIGLLIAAIISILIPDNFFITYVGNDYLIMLIILVVSIPLYVCATASVPIAAILILKGISPGAALVFLMAGPATNAATITLISKVFGRKTLFVYLFSIIAGALFFGILINNFFPRDLFISHISNQIQLHSSHGILPLWLKIVSSITLLLLIINGYFQKYKKKKNTLRSNKPEISRQSGSPQSKKMNENIENIEVTIIVKGMTCNHCKMSVEKNIGSIQGIEDVNADLISSQVNIKGKNIDLKKIKSVIKDIGYEYGGEMI